MLCTSYQLQIFLFFRRTFPVFLIILPLTLVDTLMVSDEETV